MIHQDRPQRCQSAPSVVADIGMHEIFEVGKEVVAFRTIERCVEPISTHVGA